MRIVAIKRKDGGVSIIRIHSAEADVATEVLKWDLVHNYETGKDEQRDSFVSYTEVEETDIPTDRDFRNAWGHDLKVNMPKARSIHMDVIRKERNYRLKELDIETLKGIDVQNEKQVLRDITETIDLKKAKTPDELKATWPKGWDRPKLKIEGGKP